MEDGIVGADNLKPFLQERIKVNGETGNLSGRVVTTEGRSKITITPEVPFPKRYLKYLTKNISRIIIYVMGLHTVANSRESYKLHYFQIYQDEEGED